MKQLKKIRKILFGFPFIFGVLTSILINFGGSWITQVKEFTVTEVKYNIIVDDADKDSDVITDAKVPDLDYDPADYDPERVETIDPIQRIAELVPGDDGILHLKFSVVENFDSRFLRPRFLADEISLKKKVCVAVIASSVDTLNSTSTFLSDHLKEFVDKVIVFVVAPTSFSIKSSQISNLVAFEPSKHSESTTSLKVLNYLSTKLIESFEIFVLIRDSSHVNPYRLRDFISKLSVDDDLYIGKAFKGHESDLSCCDLNTGIIISKSVLKNFKSNLDWCSEQSFNNGISESINLGRCLQKGFPIQCQSSILGASYETVDFGKRSIQFDENPIVSFPVKDLSHMKVLHVQSLQKEFDVLSKSVTKIEKEISAQSSQTTGGRFFDSTTWPPGSQPRTRSKDRFENDFWTRFNSTHCHQMYFESRVTALSQNYQEDIREVIDEALSMISKSIDARLKFSKLENGWFHFDANRGTDYLLWLQFKDSSGSLVSKFAHVFREISTPKNFCNAMGVTMPFVTEAVKVFLLVPVDKDETDSAQKLVARFLKNCITENQDRGIHLLMVLLPSVESEDKETLMTEVDQAHDRREKIKQQKKSSPNWNITLTEMSTLSSSNVDVSTVLHILSKELVDKSSLVFMGSTEMDLKLSFFNRVRMNSVSGRQIFCPIPFKSYHPKIVQWVHKKLRKTVGADGYFDTLSRNFVSFYVSDFIAAVENSKNIQLGRSLCEVLSAGLPNAIVLRAPDPNLVIFHRDKICSDTEDDDRCWQELATSLGPRVHLGRILLDHEEKLGRASIEK